MRHLEIKKHQVGIDLIEQRRDAPGVGKAMKAGESVVFQDLTEQCDVRFLIIHDQDLAILKDLLPHRQVTRSARD